MNNICFLYTLTDIEGTTTLLFYVFVVVKCIQYFVQPVLFWNYLYRPIYTINIARTKHS